MTFNARKGKTEKILGNAKPKADIVKTAALSTRGKKDGSTARIRKQKEIERGTKTSIEKQ